MTYRPSAVSVCASRAHHSLAYKGAQKGLSEGPNSLTKAKRRLRYRIGCKAMLALMR